MVIQTTPSEPAQVFSMNFSQGPLHGAVCLPTGRGRRVWDDTWKQGKRHTGLGRYRCIADLYLVGTTSMPQPTWSATTNEQPDWSATTDDQPDWNATVHSRVRAVLRSTMASAVRLRWDVGLWWLVVLVSVHCTGPCRRPGSISKDRRATVRIPSNAP